MLQKRRWLTTTCLLAAVALTLTAAGEDLWDFKSPRAKAAKKSFDAIVDKAQQEYDRRVTIARKRLADDLDIAINIATKSGDLDEALKLRAAKEQVEQGGGAATGDDGEAAPGPPQDAIKFGGHHYKVYQQPMTFHQAKAFCEAQGGHLVRIQDAREQQFVQALVSREQRGDAFWIDGTDEVIEGRWLFSDGSAMRFVNWAPSQPNNLREIEHHIQLRKTDNGIWSDFAAGIREPFVCEWDD